MADMHDSAWFLRLIHSRDICGSELVLSVHRRDFHSGRGRSEGARGGDLSEKDLRSTKTRSRRISPSRPAERRESRVLSISFSLREITTSLSMPRLSLCEKSTRCTKIKITIFDDLLGRRKKKVPKSLRSEREINSTAI